MAHSRQIAGLVGPSLAVVTVLETVNWRIWAGNAPPVVFLNGWILFVAGLAIVRAHNVWTPRWPVLVTLIGWGALAAGLARMAFPEARPPPASALTFAVIAILALIGAFLSYQAYFARGVD